jgi:voltage-gated potassium channel
MDMPWASPAPADAESNPVEGPRGRRFLRLLILMVGMLVLAPLLDECIGAPLLDDVFLTAVFISAAYSFSRNRLLLVCLIGLALPALCATWAGLLYHTRWLTIVGGACEAAFLGALTVAILAHIFREQDVSADTIAGAIVVYLLMAVMWSQVYLVMETLRPGSFVFSGATGALPLPLLKYFSFVTITTVGYGDITPATAGARALANLEAVVGQLYLVIQVAWLVGMHVSRRSK